MWYKNIAGRFFGLVTKHACDRRTDGQTSDSQDRETASIARAVKNYFFDSPNSDISTALLALSFCLVFQEQ